MQIAEISINYKPLNSIREMKKVSNSKDAADFFRSIWSDRIEYIEEFYLLLLNRRSHILGYVKISAGGTAGTVVDPKTVFQAALKANAHGIIMCHNHPSGSLTPSERDREITRRIKEAGRTLDIQLLDHIILTADSFYSFADEGVI